MKENLTTYRLLDLVRIIIACHDNYFFIIDTASAVTNITSMISNCTNISVFWNSSALSYNLEIYDGITKQLLRSVSVNNTSYHFENTELFIHCYTYVITAEGGLSNNATFSYQRGIMTTLYIV